MNTSDEEKFFMLLRSAFLEIRMSAHEDDCKKAGKIADIFHNMPGEALHSIRSGKEIDYMRLLESIVQTAEHRGLQAWVTTRISNS